LKKDNVKNIYAKILAFTLLLLMIIASSACSSSKPKETATKEAPKQEAVKIRVQPDAGGKPYYQRHGSFY